MCVSVCFVMRERQRQTEMRGDIWVLACHGAWVEMTGQWVTALWHPFLCSALHDFEGPNSGRQAFASGALTYWAALLALRKAFETTERVVLCCPPHKTLPCELCSRFQDPGLLSTQRKLTLARPGWTGSAEQEVPGRSSLSTRLLTQWLTWRSNAKVSSFSLVRTNSDLQFTFRSCLWDQIRLTQELRRQLRDCSSSFLFRCVDPGIRFLWEPFLNKQLFYAQKNLCLGCYLKGVAI